VDTGPAIVFAPDGRTMVLLVRHDDTTRLYVRRLDQLAATALAGTEGATNPFFSPDGSQIGFFASGGLKTIPVAGGATTTLADAATGRGAAWDVNGEIVFQPSVFQQTPLVRIAADGTVTDRGTVLTSEEATHRWPQILPGGPLLYSGHSTVSGWDDGTLRVAAQPGVAGKLVHRGGYHARYVPTGHLLYVHAGTLYGVRFDLERLEVTSPPAAIIDGVAATPGTGGAQYAVAATGTLAYVPGAATTIDSRMHWMTADGTTTVLATMPGTWGNARVSPDGRRIAVQVTYGRHDQIAIYDLDAARLTQITFDAVDHRLPIWTHDGRRIIYSSEVGAGVHNIFWRHADGSGLPERLTTSLNHQLVSAVHPEGRFLVFSEEDGAAPSDIQLLSLEGSDRPGWRPGDPRPLVAGAAFEGLSAVSADGRLHAYMSSEQGPFAIYVRPIDGTGGPWRVSPGTGAHPTWSKTTNTLLYTNDDQIMAVSYRFDGATFEAEAARPWAPTRYATGGPIRKYDLHPDGRRVIIASPVSSEAAVSDTIVFVTDFFGELARLIPGDR